MIPVCGHSIVPMSLICKHFGEDFCTYELSGFSLCCLPCPTLVQWWTCCLIFCISHTFMLGFMHLLGWLSLPRVCKDFLSKQLFPCDVKCGVKSCVMMMSVFPAEPCRVTFPVAPLAGLGRFEYRVYHIHDKDPLSAGLNNHSKWCGVVWTTERKVCVVCSCQIVGV